MPNSYGGNFGVGVGTGFYAQAFGCQVMANGFEESLKMEHRDA